MILIQKRKKKKMCFQMTISNIIQIIKIMNKIYLYNKKIRWKNMKIAIIKNIKKERLKDLIQINIIISIIVRIKATNFLFTFKQNYSKILFKSILLIETIIFSLYVVKKNLININNNNNY